MLKGMEWARIQHSEIPEEVKPFLSEAREAENKLNFTELLLDSPKYRSHIRNRLFEAEEIIQRLLKRYSRFITKGYEENSKEDIDRAKKINEVLKNLLITIEKVKTDEKSTLKQEKPLKTILLIYSNYLSKILWEMIYESMKDAVESGSNFYRELFESTWDWCKIQAFSIEKEEKSEELEGEKKKTESEEMKPNDILENLGKIS